MLLLTCNNFETHLSQSLNLLRQNDEFTDVTLTCDLRDDYDDGSIGFRRFKQFKAHKIILSVASPYFKDMFLGNPAPHPVIMLRQIYAEDLEAILHFIYNGETHVREENLNDFLATAKFLQIYGYLSGDEGDYKSFWKSPKKKGRKKAAAVDSDGEIVESEGEGEEIIYHDGDDFEYEAPRFNTTKRKMMKSMAPKKKRKPNIDDGEGSECPKCMLTFWSASARRNHEDVHESEKTNCDSCEKVFPHSALLAEHVKKVHTQHEHSDMPDLTEFGFQNPNNADGSAGPKTGAAEPLMIGMDRTLDPEEAFALLSGADVAADGELLSLEKPKGGDIYLFNIANKDTIAKRLKVDGYKWKNKNTIQFPNNSMSKTYFYARTPFGTLKDFYKHQYVSEDGTRVLIHYLGDELLYKDFKRGVTPKRKASRNFFKIRTIKPEEMSSHSDQNQVTVYSYKDIVPQTKTSVQIHHEQM